MDDFKTRLTNRFLPGDRMIGFTPDGESEGMIRADKIRYWILNSGYDIIRYIVLDDEVKANYNTKVGKFFLNIVLQGLYRKNRPASAKVSGESEMKILLISIVA